MINPTILLLDTFSADVAAGAVNGTTSDSGAVRSATAASVDIASGELHQLGTGVWGESSLYYDLEIARQAGVVLAQTINFQSTVPSAHMFGFRTDESFTFGGHNSVGWTTSAGSAIGARFTSGATSPSLGQLVSDVEYTFYSVLRSAGRRLFLKTASGYPLLLWVDNVNASTPLYAASTLNSSSNIYADDFVVAGYWLPMPLLSDGFGSTFGTSDGLGHAEGIAGGIGSGGGSVTLTTQSGSWSTSGGKALGTGIATAALSTKDVYAAVKFTRSAGSGGLTLRYTDANNHLYAEHDGTNCYLKQVLAGVTTTLITAAATYSAGAQIVTALIGNAGRLYYNNALVGSTASINAGLTATNHGITSSNAGNQLDDLVIYASGTSGEYETDLMLIYTGARNVNVVMGSTYTNVVVKLINAALAIATSATRVIVKSQPVQVVVGSAYARVVVMLLNSALTIATSATRVIVKSQPVQVVIGSVYTNVIVKTITAVVTIATSMVTTFGQRIIRVIRLLGSIGGSNGGS